MIASQRVMLERLGKQGSALSDRRLAQTYLQQIKRLRNILEQYPEKVSVLSVDYHQAISEPEKVATIVNDFFGGQLDAAKMVNAIEPKLRRQGS